MVSRSRRYVMKDVEVDVTDDVEELAEQLMEDRIAKGLPVAAPGVLFDSDAAVLAVRRACAREGAAPSVVLRCLLRHLQCDHLTREVGALLGGRRL